MTLDLIKSKPRTELNSLRINERMRSLGIPVEEMTPKVALTVSALMEKLDDVMRELSRTKETLGELEQLVDVDCVAPIPNRRAFMRRLSWAISMHSRYKHPSSVLYFDLNDFKQINDNHGHAAGDLVIRHVAQLLSSSLRDSDFLARIGGDEFAIIMYYAKEETARQRGRLITEKLENTPFIYNGQQLHISAAFGYHSLRNGDDAEAALSASDMSMYIDKRRNKEKTLAS